METKKAVLAGLGCLVLGLGVGYGAGRVSTGTPLDPFSGRKEEDRIALLRSIHQDLVDQGLLPAPVTETNTLTGTVTGVDGEGRVTIEAETRDFDPLGAFGIPKTRTVTVTAATEMIRLSRKSPEELAADEAAYQAAMDAYAPDPEDPSAPPTPPSAFRETRIIASDLVPGDIVSVQAELNILRETAFEATRLTVAAPEEEAPPVTPEPAPEETAPVAASEDLQQEAPEPAQETAGPAATPEDLQQEAPEPAAPPPTEDELRQEP